MRTHASLEGVVSHVAADLVPLSDSMYTVERLDVVPIDEEGTALLSELVHVEEEVERDHRIAVVVVVAEAGAVDVACQSVSRQKSGRCWTDMMATRCVRCAR